MHLVTSDPCSTPSLQSLCIYSLANTEAGQAVVNIMGVGVDTINTVLAAQPSRCVYVSVCGGWGWGAKIRDLSPLSLRNIILSVQTSARLFVRASIRDSR